MRWETFGWTSLSLLTVCSGLCACGDSEGRASRDLDATVTEPNPSTDPDADAATDRPDSAADSGKDGGSGVPPAGSSYEFEVRGGTVTGTIDGSSITITEAPARFRTELVVWAVQRNLVTLNDEAQTVESCREPLGVADGLNRPLYALRDVLLNPLAANELIRELRKRPEGERVRRVVNPFEVESIEFDNGSLQTGLPRGIVGSDLLGASDLPRSQYDWDLLCRGLGATEVVARAVVRGTWNGAPHELAIEYTPIRVVAR